RRRRGSPWWSTWSDYGKEEVLGRSSLRDMPDEVVDLIRIQDEMKAHTREFALWPLKWQEYVPGNYAWQLRRLHAADVNTVPDSAGVYTLLIQPGIATHPSCSYLMYVGRSDSLRRRFRDYLGPERRATGRPKIYRL